MKKTCSPFLMSVRVKGGVLAWDLEVGGGGTVPLPSLGLERGPHSHRSPLPSLSYNSTTAGTVHPPDPTFSSQNKVCFVPSLAI